MTKLRFREMFVQISLPQMTCGGYLFWFGSLRPIIYFKLKPTFDDNVSKFRWWLGRGLRYTEV